MSNARIVRFIKIGAYGERSGCQLLIKADASQPAAADGAEWHIDPTSMPVMNSNRPVSGTFSQPFRRLAKRSSPDH
jgi:hypothetical protein